MKSVLCIALLLLASCADPAPGTESGELAALTPTVQDVATALDTALCLDAIICSKQTNIGPQACANEMVTGYCRVHACGAVSTVTQAQLDDCTAQVSARSCLSTRNPSCYYALQALTPPF